VGVLISHNLTFSPFSLTDNHTPFSVIGWVNQWGEVKTKKAKKESQQKAKTEAAAAANQHQQSPSTYSSQQRPDRSQKGSEQRAPRGGRGKLKTLYKWSCGNFEN
jgi:hypothetical protein